ncbi:hypothetical protein C8244_10840 [Paracidovorax avenae]|uniref:hypothetical protein n=1 Tax=Paracidovorax avenae TaxID=80867 RepID=UPI000D1740C9|nr:hypothetical protein [Paracidovorax avenae]AVS81505.1 hypothetical protein C8237_10695 [Paracidovorax avenae]AVT16636.1 hypothetical protein C8244_10840 [Paracidovorax avenae]
MPRITVEKYVAGTLERSFEVPGLLVRVAAWVLPASALTHLKDRGMDVHAILQAWKSGSPYASSMDVTEHGVQKKVCLLVS